jgi:hypothetical protein
MAIRINSWIRQQRADGLALLGLLGFACALVAPIFWGGVPIGAETLSLWGPGNRVQAWPVSNQALADSGLLMLPWQVWIRQSLAAGEWPLWNPNVFAGYPFAGSAPNQLYYPVMWLLWLLPLPTAFQVGALLHLWLAGAGLYLFSRVLGVSRLGSGVAGLAFMASAPLITALELPTVSYVYVWLPWIMAAAEQAWRRQSWGWAVTATLLVGVQVVAGLIQWPLYSLLILALWLGARAVAAARANRGGPPAPWRIWRAQVARAILIGSAGPLLAAVHLLPFVELLGYSSRVGQGAAGVSQTPLVAWQSYGDTLTRFYLSFIIPQISGTPNGSVGKPADFNTTWYFGLVALALAGLALLLRPDRRTALLGAIGLLGFAAATGMPGVDAVNHLPGFQALVRERAAYGFIFGLVVLSGIGLDAWLAAVRERPRRALGALLGLGAVAGVLAWGLAVKHDHSVQNPTLYAHQLLMFERAAALALGLLLWLGLTLALRGGQTARGRTALLAVPLVLSMADLASALPDYNSYVSPAMLNLDAPSAAAMRADASPWRMLAVDTPSVNYVPNTTLLYGLPTVQGYDSLHLTRYESYWAAADPTIRQTGYFGAMMRPQAYTAPQAALLNARYIVSSADLNTKGPLPATLLPGFNGEVRVYTNTAALPRVFVVSSAEVVPPDTIPTRIAAPGFDPRQAVLLEQPPPAGFAAVPPSAAPPGTAVITRYRNLSVDLTAQLDRPGWLVLGDVNYPGWSVTVDGQPAPLYTAYYILRAVPLPTGQHQVHFYYLPPIVLLGGGISAATLLLLLGIGYRAYRSRRRMLAAK